MLLRFLNPKQVRIKRPSCWDFVKTGILALEVSSIVKKNGPYNVRGVDKRKTRVPTEHGKQQQKRPHQAWEAHFRVLQHP